MAMIKEGDLLWEPSEAVREQAQLTQYMRWLEEKHGLVFDSYQELWQWSVNRLEQFWGTLWDYFDIQASRQPRSVLAERTMPGARWFSGAHLNYAENIFIKMKREGPVLFYQDEAGPLLTLNAAQLFQKTGRLAQVLKERGVQQGDRVVAYLPNIPEAIIGLLATASLGAIWSSCSPDFGSRSVLDRFSQIEPKILLAVDGYRYNGKNYNRLDVVRRLQAALPTVEQTILVPLLGEETADLPGTILWENALNSADAGAPFTFAQVPFDHPLWVLYSSGTTGLPKPIVHGHGGIILEHLKELTLHMDLGLEDRFFWYTSTGWMMWNFVVGGLLTGSSIVLYNGSPSYPDLNRLWQLADELMTTYFGTSAAFIHACMKAGLKPNEQVDLGQIRAIGSTGSPLSPGGFQWVYENVNDHLALESFSGGSDLCTGFVGGIRTQPIYAGEIQGPSLGASVEAYDEKGQPMVNQVGELVITRPMPSMPLYFWNDEGDRRYRRSYFKMYPGIWRHGDWIKLNEHGGCIIYGRSDATINRHGVRMGTSEIYQTVQALPEIADSLVVDLEGMEGESYMPLFIVLEESTSLDEALRQKIRQKLREELSPRHVPDEIISVPEIPYTLSGKKMELPVRRILEGEPVEEAVNPGAMRNPLSIDFFEDLAKKRSE